LIAVGGTTSLAWLAMELGIEGKVALVTAATRGIGLGIAKALAAEGARVSLVARTASDVQRVAESIGCFGIAADLLTEEGCKRAVEETEHGLGRIDILVNNMGARAGSSWKDTGVAEFEAAFHGNLVVTARMTDLVLPRMLERGWGRIVVISSVFGREWGGAPAYNAAKAAENSYVKSLAREIASRGVTVNAVAPGSILWEGGGWHRRQGADPQGIAAFVGRELPMGRFGTVEEVASVVAFVSSTQASLLTGACIPVDGGQGRSII
jgi:3-oxoacyl-[acyl-carrier protein] reductase